MPRRYYTVEPRLARLLEPGDRYPVDKIITSVEKRTNDIVVGFDDGTSMHLDYTDALMIATPPASPSPASEMADVVPIVAEIIQSEPPAEVVD